MHGERKSNEEKGRGKGWPEDYKMKEKMT